jgi:phage tail tape-measure protein
MRNPMGLGLAGIGAGLLTSAITSNMEAGGGKTAVSALGGATTGALTGASVGALFGGVGAVPGAIIGGLLGGISNLISGLNEDREQRKQETETTKEAQRKANETLEALATRPLELKVNNDTIANWNTYSQQNGANGRLSS